MKLLIPLLVIGLTIIPTSAEQTPDKHKICEYLEIELQFGVENGYLTQNEATDIIQRCYS